MKKQTIIIVFLCVLVAAVVALNVLGVIGPQESTSGSLAGYTVRNNEVSPPNTIPPLVVNPEYSFPSTP